MAALSRRPWFPRLPGGRALLGLVLVSLAGHALGQPADDRAGKKDGLILPVRAPIDKATTDRVEAAVQDALRKGRKLERVVFAFNPDKQTNDSANIDDCVRLKRFILELSTGKLHAKGGAPIRTVAYLQGEVRRHSVLPVLACQDIVLAKNASLGDVLGNQDRLPDADRAHYEEVARLHKGQEDVIFKMLDPGLVLVKAVEESGVRYLDQKKVSQVMGDKPHKIEAVPEGAAGKTNTVLTAATAQKFNLTEGAALDSVDKVARHYDLLPHVRREAPLWDPGVRKIAFCVEFTGPVDDERLGWLDRSLRDAVSQDANVIVLQLDSQGGETEKAYSAALNLRNLKDKNGQPVLTIAYVPAERKLGAATFLALGCSEIVMSGRAALGDFTYLKNENAEALAHKRKALVELATGQGYPAAPFEAMLAPGQFKELDARTAAETGVARRTDVEDLAHLYRDYEIDPQQVKVLRGDWLSAVAAFFRQPWVMVLLVLVGVTGLLLELKVPGIGVPGVVAALCFVLFFWSYSFVGQFTVLAVLLFVLGLVLIGVEVFVLPGFGVTGVSGILLVLVSLALVTLERMPATTGDWYDVGGKMLMFGASLVGAFFGAMVIAWFLPNLPFANRLVLLPPTDSEDTATKDARQAVAELLGAIGVAATTLRPAGKAKFGDEYLDVIAENDYVNPGSRVQVIEIEGNRIVVKEV